MNHRFLRDEAARFRAMAEDTDHEATRLRRLAMAADYEARANAAAAAVVTSIVAPEATDTAVAEPEAAVDEQPAPAAPTAPKTTRLRLDKQNVRGLKETIVVERQSTLRRSKPSNGTL
jgi:hypothetical protein